jgi:antitoxin HicB
MKKDFNYYMALPYTIEILPDQPDGWYAGIKELPGCMTTAQTAEEALADIKELKEEWLQNAIEDKFEIPEPRAREEYSGNFRLRVPKSLHRKLVEAADIEDVSLNSICVSLLAEAIGIHSSKELYGQPSGGKDWQQALRQICDFLGLKTSARDAEVIFSEWLKANLQGSIQQNQPLELFKVITMLQGLGKASPVIASIAELLIQMQQALIKRSSEISSKPSRRSEQEALVEWEERTTETVIKRQLRSVQSPDINERRSDPELINATSEFQQLMNRNKGR